jgi:hypothetical protein
MTTRIFALALVCALALTSSAFARNAKATADWTAVQSLSSGEKIVVHTKDGDRLTGRFESATDQAINFTHDGKKVSLTRESIKRVQLNRGKSRLNGTLLGAAIGAGAGLAAGAIISSKGDINVAPTIGGLTALGAGIGAGIGAALAKGNENVTIYEAP